MSDYLISSKDSKPCAFSLLGPVVAMADPSVLQPRTAPPSRLTLALWAVLVISVGSVLALSVRLLRRMSRGDGGSPS